MNAPVRQAQIVPAPYVCPDCKQPLARWRCATCGHEFPCRDGVPRLVSRDPRFERAAAIAAAYDTIYTERSQVWENQGRTPEFVAWFGALLDRFPAARLLEIGCGEGFVLATRREGVRFATDLSLAAIRRARKRADARFSLALAERLPFAADSFELVASVGVMEHFLDIGAALAEIRRVLAPGGRYVSLTHVDLTPRERLGWLGAQFVWPRLRPLALARWLAPRLRSRLPWHRGAVPQQPIQNRYTTAGAQSWLARAGFTVEDVKHTRSDPNLPLIGPSVVVFVARK
jgi:SAM-dependent methyltransferase/rubredoxin